MGEIFEQVAAVSEQMMHNHLHKDEMLLLQAMVLVNAGMKDINTSIKQSNSLLSTSQMERCT
jgi:hypothetical protein